jgi:hypothetical protein
MRDAYVMDKYIARIARYAAMVPRQLSAYCVKAAEPRDLVDG